MTENVIGEYQCRDCPCTFKIEETSITAYDGWLPTCPCCGTKNDVQVVDRPKHTG